MIKDSKVPEGQEETDKNEEMEKAGEPFTPEVSPEDIKGELDPEEESTEQLKADLEKSQKEYLYLFSEFENYKKRTLRERMELMKSASQDVIVAMLPVLDDFERALKHLDEKDSGEKNVEGVGLIFSKLKSVLEQAITQIPADGDHPANTIVDEAECGYMLNDKVIRHAKVVVAG
jgi:molecular chaperone GrpE